MEPRQLLEVRDLKTWFYLEQGIIRAVDGVSFQLRRGRRSESWVRAAVARA